MPKPPASDPSGRGRPTRPGRPSSSGRAGGRGAGSGAASSRGAGRGGATGRAGARGQQSDERASEGPPWKRRAEARAKDDSKGKAAGWGGVARKGAGRIRDEGRGGGASAAFREAAGTEAWEPEVWIDQGVVREEAEGAVGRGRSSKPRRVHEAADDAQIESDPSLQRAVGAAKAERIEAKLRDAGRAFRRERFEEVRKILRPLAESVPTAAAVRELLGLTYYRLGRWKMAVSELEAFRELTGSTEQHPVIADCYRALGRHGKVAELWDELRDVSPSAALVAEGRIVYAGSLADQGQLRDAIAVLEASKKPTKRPKDHHLRVTYALADLYERAGDVPRARQLFGIVAAADPDLGDVAARIRSLG